MRIRLEFYQSHSAYFNLAVELSKKQPTYQAITTEAGIKHCIEFDGFTEEFQGIYRFARSWKGAFFYINGNRIKAHKIWRLIWDEENKNRKPSEHKPNIRVNGFDDSWQHNRIRHPMSGDEILAEIKRGYRKP